jgi:hypothetical protein
LRDAVVLAWPELSMSGLIGLADLFEFYDHYNWSASRCEFEHLMSRVHF